MLVKMFNFNILWNKRRWLYAHRYDFIFQTEKTNWMLTNILWHVLSAHKYIVHFISVVIIERCVCNYAKRVQLAHETFKMHCKRCTFLRILKEYNSQFTYWAFFLWMNYAFQQHLPEYLMYGGYIFQLFFLVRFRSIKKMVIIRQLFCLL